MSRTVESITRKDFIISELNKSKSIIDNLKTSASLLPPNERMEIAKNLSDEWDIYWEMKEMLRSVDNMLKEHYSEQK